MPETISTNPRKLNTPRPWTVVWLGRYHEHAVAVVILISLIPIGIIIAAGGRLHAVVTVGLAVLASSALVATGAFWIALGARWSAARYAVLLAATIGAIAWLYIAVQEDSALWEFVVFFLAQIVYIAASLWLVRLAGYRLAWRRRVWL